MILTNVVAELYAAIITLLLLICVSIDKSLDIKSNKYMKQMIYGNLSLLLFTIATWLLEGKPEMEALDYLCTFMAGSLGFLMAWLFTNYAEYLIQENDKPRRWVTTLVRVECIAAVAINFSSIFNHVFYSCEGSVYKLGPYAFINYLFPVIILGPEVVMILISSRRTGNKSILLLIAYVALPILSSLIIPSTGYDTLCLATTLSVLLLYVTVYVRRGKMLALQEKELADARVDVMLSQIQPHFLYNALSVIQDMCHGKSPEAEKTTVEFSEFLRGNLDSLAIKETIPFTQELHHTQNYLSLVGMKYGNRLNINYDIRDSHFRMPALTLQPIVENAVRYGIMQLDTEGTVEIRSYETAKDHVIEVVDNGMGYDVMEKKYDGRTHIGISNVRERLRSMCGGELNITSREGVGTDAVIRIPKHNI